MKKQKIQFIVILIVLAVLIAATFGMKWYNKNKEEEKTAEEEASTIYISKVDVDTITAFSYEVDHVTYTFTKDGDTWTYDGDTSLDMDEEAIDSMLSTLSSLTAIEEISDYTDLKEFGFDQPEDLISYTTSEGSVSLFVGNNTPLCHEPPIAPLFSYGSPVLADECHQHRSRSPLRSKDID